MPVFLKNVKLALPKNYDEISIHVLGRWRLGQADVFKQKKTEWSIVGDQ